MKTERVRWWVAYFDGKPDHLVMGPDEEKAVELAQGWAGLEVRVTVRLTSEAPVDDVLRLALVEVLNSAMAVAQAVQVITGGVAKPGRIVRPMRG